ncbi:AraC family transcriptional regulator [Paenibacillus sp. FJAT-26967]|uniref:AraC family transcriptional regulator n=1 Tax=Paenibacillus sp. FJAT-26967 TaxID=1729690 RepID=UPI0008382BBF|nr:AraC family transcriptional regulator [Paenibacillus sp. FJAT-26967]
MAPAHTYYVVSNPSPHGDVSLHVLFSGESQTKPAHRLGPKVFDYFLIHIVVSGRGYYTSGGRQLELGPGDSFCIEPEQLVSYASDSAEPWRYCWIAFTGTEAAALIRGAGFTPGQPVIRTAPGSRVPGLFRRLQRALRHKSGTASRRALGYLHLLLAEYADAALPAVSKSGSGQSRTEVIVQQMLHYLSTQYSEDISIESMAQTLGYNRAYLSRLFKEHTGQTPVSFLSRLRVDKARQLLRERMELTIEQIAFSVGIRDPLYFSKQFRKYYGIAPTEYRNEMKRL